MTADARRNFKVIAHVQDWGWNDSFEHDHLKHRPDLYGPRLVEELVKARSKTEAQFRMKDRNPCSLVKIVEISEVFFNFDYTPDKWEDEEFYLFMYESEVSNDG